MLTNDRVTVLKEDGRRWEMWASVGPKLIVIDTQDTPIEEGDKVERKLRTGVIEVYRVLEAAYFDGPGGIPPHYQLHVEKETAIPRRGGSGGSTVYNITGPGARFNLNSIDSSTNVVNVARTELFDQLREAIKAGVADATEQSELLRRVAALEQAQTTAAYLQGYQQLIQHAANHMTILAPFLPAFAQLLSK
jgi:hypothetical protein